MTEDLIGEKNENPWDARKEGRVEWEKKPIVMESDLFANANMEKSIWVGSWNPDGL